MSEMNKIAQALLDKDATIADLRQQVERLRDHLAAVRKAAWDGYDLGCNVKELVAQGRFPCSEMEHKYGPRPRSKR